MPAIRGKVMSFMRKAIKEGQSRTAFLRDMKAKDLMYVRKRMIADWSKLTDVHKKIGAMTRIGRDVFPGARTIITTDWRTKEEYYYVVKVKTRIRVDAPITEHEISIESDKRLTPRMVEQRVWAEWPIGRSPPEEILEEATPWMVYKRPPQ